MKVVTTEQIRALDRRAIEEFGIPGPVLMENAGRAVVDVLAKEYGPLRGKRIAIFCGSGNNGGDGFVIARLLHLVGAIIRPLLTGSPQPKTDAKIHFDILRHIGISCDGIPNAPWTIKETLEGSDLIVDALLGTGLREAPAGAYADAIRVINEANCPVVSVDIPSGVQADTGATPGEVVKATHTVTFAYPKIGLFLFPGAACVGQLHVADIGFDWARLNEPSPFRLLEPTFFTTPLLKKRAAESNKGDYGHLGILAGSRGMVGAPALTARAAQRSGAGLVTVLAPESVQPTIAAKLDEQMTVPLPESNGALSEAAFEKIARYAERFDALCIGPGLTTGDETTALILRLLKEIEKPVVLDADGLNALATKPEILAGRQDDSVPPLILTPHPGEAARLLGTSIAEVQSKRVESVRELAKRFQAVVVLKGRHSLIADPSGNVSINTTGNPGMATGGSGDTLTGLIGGLLAQAVAPVRVYDGSLWDVLDEGLAQEVAELGVYLHGLAGDLAAEQTGEAGLTAGDLSAYLPAARRRLTGI